MPIASPDEEDIYVRDELKRAPQPPPSPEELETRRWLVQRYLTEYIVDTVMNVGAWIQPDSVTVRLGEDGNVYAEIAWLGHSFRVSTTPDEVAHDWSWIAQQYAHNLYLNGKIKP